MAFKLTLTAEDRELLAAYHREKQANDELKRKIREMADESKRAAQEQESRIDKAVGGIARIAAGYLSLQTVVRAYNSELQKKWELEQKSAGAQQAVAGSQQSFLTNLGFVDKGTRRQAVADVEAIARRTGVTAGTLYGAASDAVSARGAVSIPGALSAVEAAALVAGNQPDQIRALSGGILDVAGMTGLMGDADAKKNLGFLMGIGSLARVTNLQAISQNLVPGMKGVRGFGDTAAQAGALVATLTSAMADATGAVSGTAGISLAQQLEQFLPEANSTIERIEKLQQDPALREKFFKGASFEKRAFVPIRDILTGGSEAAKLLAANQQAVLAPEAAEQALDKWLVETADIDAQRVAEFGRRGDVAIDTISRADRIRGVRGTAREKVREAIALSGGSATVQAGQNFISDYLGPLMGSEADYGQELDARIREMTTIPGARPGTKEFYSQRQLSAGEQQIVDALRDLKASLESAQKEGNSELKKINGRRPAPDPKAHTE